MNRSETANLLTSMASFDRRTIGESDVIAWQAVLADAAFDDCLEAVKRHYAENTEWMMPAHVRRIVRDIHGERDAAARSTGWAPGQYKVPKGQAMPEVAGPVAEGTVAPSVMELLLQVRAMLPEGSREALAPRRVAWEREHKAFLRTQSSNPNPLYKPQTANYYDTQATAGPSGEPSPIDTTGPDTGILPNAYRCGGCSFTTASLDRWDGHEQATGHQHEGGPGDEPPPCICSYKGMSGGHADHCPLATW